MLLLCGLLLVALMTGLLLLFLWEERRSEGPSVSHGLLTAFWRNPERRRDERQPLAVWVVYEPLNGNARKQGPNGETTNVSVSGMCLRTFEHLTDHTQIRFEIRPPAYPEPIRGLGEVRWVREEPPTGPRRSFCTGIQFTQITPQDRQRLEQLLNHTRVAVQPKEPSHGHA